MGVVASGSVHDYPFAAEPERVMISANVGVGHRKCFPASQVVGADRDVSLNVTAPGATSTIATLGGSYEDSIRQVRPPVLIDGEILISTQTEPYFCGFNCSPNGTQAPVLRTFAAPVKRQNWHNPAT